MNDAERPASPARSPHRIDRAAAEALGYSTINATEYAQRQADAALLAQLEAEGLL